MRKYLLAAVATAAIASPAIARDGQPYIGIEGGLLFPKDQDADIFVDFTTTQTVPTSPMVVGPVDGNSPNGAEIDYKRGRDLDLIAGYDFGMFRLEGEIAFKRAKLDEFGFDPDLIDDLNVALNRPSGVGDTGAPGAPALVDADFDLDGTVKVRSFMLNGLVDFGDEDGLSFYAGVGAGRARVKLLGQSDSSWAGQLIAGVRYALSDNIDLGLKYRYFRTGKINLSDEGFLIDGNPDTVVAGTVPTTTDVTTDAFVSTDFEQKFRSHSLLASLIFNFGGEKAPPPPPPYVAPPPPPPPATQTCPDGSVILASDMCPPAPEPYVPPPPPPEPAPERG